MWWDEDRELWRTDFPPPEDFEGEEEGDYGDHGYERDLSPAEEAVCEARRRRERAILARAGGAARDAFFARAAAEGSATISAPAS